MIAKPEGNDAPAPTPESAPHLALRGKHDSTADAFADAKPADEPEMLYATANLLFHGDLAYTPGQPISAAAAERNGWSDQVSSTPPAAPTPGSPSNNQEA